MTDAYAPLRALFAGAGYAFVEPAIVHDAGVFVELAGEDLRRRLYLTAAVDGKELALRPDYTIPVCLHHLATGPAARRADYAYLGPVFRQRNGEAGEFLQAGVESLGRSDRIAADADVFALALSAVKLLGNGDWSLRIGDSALFASVLSALDVDAPWRRRLSRIFGDRARMTALVAGAAGRDDMPPVDRRAVRHQAARILSATGLGTVGGRTADEIADRMVEKAQLAAGLEERARSVLARFLAVSGPAPAALKRLRALARRDSLDIGTAIARFEERLDAFAARGIDAGRIDFAADFGRRLDYYTGFVFEIHDPARTDGRQIVGGGRYDRLVGLIAQSQGAAARKAEPAVGFAIWLDRIGRPA